MGRAETRWSCPLTGPGHQKGQLLRTSLRAAPAVGADVPHIHGSYRVSASSQRLKKATPYLPTALLAPVGVLAQEWSPLATEMYSFFVVAGMELYMGEAWLLGAATP